MMKIYLLDGITDVGDRYNVDIAMAVFSPIIIDLDDDGNDDDKGDNDDDNDNDNVDGNDDGNDVDNGENDDGINNDNVDDDDNDNDNDDGTDNDNDDDSTNTEEYKTVELCASEDKCEGVTDKTVTACKKYSSAATIPSSVSMWTWMVTLYSPGA